MGGKSQPPAAPDYTGAAIAQGELGLQDTITQSQLNNPNVYSPFGSITYGSPGGYTTGGFQPSTGGYGGAPGGSLGGSGVPIGSYESAFQAAPGSYQPTGSGSPTGSGNLGGGGITIPGAAGTPGTGGLSGFLGSAVGKNKSGTPAGPSYDLSSILGSVPNERQTENINLSPAQQTLLNQQEGTQIAAGAAGNQVAGALGNTTGQLNLSGLPNATQGASTINSNVVNSLYNQQTQYLDPQFAQQQTAMDANLRAQGLVPGTEAYNNAATNFANQKQQAYSNAMDNAQQQGTQAGYLAQQENIAGANQGISEQEQQQMLPLQEISQLLGLSQPTLPTAGGTQGSSAASPANLTQALESSYGAQLGNVNASNSASAGVTSGILSALAAYLA